MDRRLGNKGFWTALGLGLLVFYLGFALLDGYGLYPDSESYIGMEVGREPLYALYLALYRLCFGRFGEGAWLTAAMLGQSVFAAWAGWFFAWRCAALFELRRLESAVIALCTLLPSLMCRFFANRHAMYSTSILSESLAFPLFTVFFIVLLCWALGGRRRELLWALLLALLLYSTRKQMVITLPLLVLAGLWRGVRTRRFRKTALMSVLLAAAVLITNALLDRGYNYVLRGEALRHTGDMRFISTMLLYTAEEEDAALFPDEDTRALFLEVLDAADEKQYRQRYAPTDWFGRSLYFMNVYDGIQFLCLRDTIEARAEERFGGDELAMALEKDRVYNAINAALLPVSAGRLVGVVCDSFLVGLVSTVLAQRRLFTLPALGLYAVFIVLLVLNIRRKREGEAAFGALTLLSILGNVALVSLTIFCQARYTLYNMPMFYAGAFLLLRGALPKKTGVDKNGN